MCNCTKTFALLIDTENVSINYIDTVMGACSGKGNISIRRAYASLDDPSLTKLREKLPEYAITPYTQFNYVSGKNSSDIRLTVDAMEILFKTDPDGFIIVSSDSDFTSLAIKLKEYGKIVIGMGKKNTPMPFIKACDEFRYVDLDESDDQEKKNVPDDAKITDNAPSEKELKKFIKKTLEESNNGNKWMKAAELGLLIKKKYTDFNPRNYECKTLTLLLDKMKFETKSVDDKNNKTKGAKIVYIKVK